MSALDQQRVIVTEVPLSGRGPLFIGTLAQLFADNPDMDEEERAHVRRCLAEGHCPIISGGAGPSYRIAPGADILQAGGSVHLHSTAPSQVAPKKPACAPELLNALVQAVEASGFRLSGPTDSRAAEDGEPAWVCNARAAIAECHAAAQEAQVYGPAAQQPIAPPDSLRAAAARALAMLRDPHEEGDSYPSMVRDLERALAQDRTGPVMRQMLDALELAEGFMAGFEDDEAQETLVDDNLDLIDQAEAAAHALVDHHGCEIVETNGIVSAEREPEFGDNEDEIAMHVACLQHLYDINPDRFAALVGVV